MMQKLKVALFLALKNIQAAKSISLLVIVIIALSFVSMAFVSALVLGVADALNSDTINYAFGNVIIQPDEESVYIEDAASVLKKVRAVPGVIAASRKYSIGATLAKGEKEVYGFGFFGVEPGEEKRVSQVYRHITRGNFLTGSKGEIVLGSFLSGGKEQSFKPQEETLEAEVGDAIIVTFANGAKRNFRLAGVANAPGFWTASFSYITIEDAEEILGVNNKASLISVKVPLGTEEQYVRKFKELGIRAEIKTWRDKMSTSKIVASVFDRINTILTAAALFMVPLVIFIVVYINILHRRRQIGILKAVGISSDVITLSYTMQSFFFAAVGIAAGIGIMEAMTAYFSRYPLDMSIGFVYPQFTAESALMPVTALTLSSLVGSFFPSAKAARENIVRLIWG